MEMQRTKYIAKDARGEIIFKLELASIETDSWIKFSCAADIDFKKHLSLKVPIKQLCSPATAPEAKAKLIQDIILQVTSLEAIDNTEKKKLDEFFNYIFSQNDFKEYVPFSETINPYFFKELKLNLTAPIQLKDMVVVERSCYESLIKAHKNLVNEYVNHYSPTATFFATAALYGGEYYEFYFMKTNRIVLIFFMEML